MPFTDHYLSLMGLAPKRMPECSPWSNPDAETYLTGIDYFDHPRQCRLKMQELYPELRLGIPETDDPKPRPRLSRQGESVSEDEKGAHHVRWGDGESSEWGWGKQFHSAEEVFAFSPLEHGDFTDIPVVESADYSSEEIIYQRYLARIPEAERYPDGQVPEGSEAGTGFYNTMFMWPLLTFGWELFLETCLDPRFERIMDEFAEINRRVFRAFARLPVRFITCHDDIVNTRGLVCSPTWMRKYIYPRYEEFWAIMQAGGKRVVFMTDGNANVVADDIMACGATGIITEPHTQFKPIARKYENLVLAGEGDNRVLTRNNPAEIEAMVRSMVETGKITGGYMMSIGNHIPWNVPGEAIKRYLELSRELAVRP